MLRAAMSDAQGELQHAILHHCVSIYNKIADSMFFEKTQQFFEVGTRQHLCLELRNRHAAFPALPRKSHDRLEIAKGNVEGALIIGNALVIPFD